MKSTFAGEVCRQTNPMVRPGCGASTQKPDALVAHRTSTATLRHQRHAVAVRHPSASQS
jgi:hypothetical protein